MWISLIVCGIIIVALVYLLYTVCDKLDSVLMQYRVLIAARAVQAAELHDAERDTERYRTGLADALKMVRYANPGAWDNGNRPQLSSPDEGDVMAWREYERLKDLLDD
jgi:hypothetical protein